MEPLIYIDPAASLSFETIRLTRFSNRSRMLLISTKWHSDKYSIRLAMKGKQWIEASVSTDIQIVSCRTTDARAGGMGVTIDRKR